MRVMWYYCAMKKRVGRRKKGESEFDKLARLIKSEGEDIRNEMSRRFGSADKRFDGVDKGFVGIDKHFDSLDEQLREIRTEITDIRSRVEHLEEQGAVQAGYAKEIDHILGRVAFIEPHLGIAKSRDR